MFFLESEQESMGVTSLVRSDCGRIDLLVKDISNGDCIHIFSINPNGSFVKFHFGERTYDKLKKMGFKLDRCSRNTDEDPLKCFKLSSEDEYLG